MTIHSSSQRKIIFLHLPKTGGTSLFHCLKQHYGEEQSQLILADDDPVLNEAIEAGKFFIHGHISFKGVVKAQNYFKIVLLRNPVDRVLSRYIHMMHSNHENLIKEREAYRSFEDYLQSTYAQNWQCQMLSGHWHQRINEATFSEAIQNLEKMDWVGVQDYLDKGILDLTYRLGFFPHVVRKLNRSKDADWQKELKAKYADEIARLNSFDEALYQKAKKIFVENYQEKPLRSLKYGLKKWL